MFPHRGWNPGVSFICETGILGPSLPCLRAHFPSVHLPKHFEKYSTAGMLKKVWSCRLPFLDSWVIVYIPQHQYIPLPVNRVKQSSLRSSPTCPPPILSEAHPGQLARVPVSHKHESKHRVLPPDFPGSNKGNGRNKKQCRVAEITNSPTFLKCDGFFSKIFRRGSTNQTLSLALAAPHFALICCKGKIVYTCILFWCKKNSPRKRKKNTWRLDEFSEDNGGSTLTG